MSYSRKLLLLLGDLMGFFIGFLLFIRIAFERQSFSEELIHHAVPMTILVALWITLFFIFNFYDLQKSKPNLVFFRNFGIAAIIMLGIGFIFFYLNPITNVAPKTNLLIFEGLSLIIILGIRRLIYFATMSRFKTRFALVCPDESHQALVDEINQNPHLGFVNAGIFASLKDFQESSTIVDFLIIHKTALVETELLEKILASNIDVIGLAEAYENILYKIPTYFINHEWVIRSIKKQGSFLYSVISRMISIVFALGVLIITSPISLGIIIAIKLEDGGPIIYKNDRSGLHGTMFYLYKFRSMIVDAEKHGAAWAEIADHRVTRVGRITRKLHIDEIPQMINLLRGDLMLVGPRPERPEFVADLERKIPYYFLRHTITPGFTGWAQIKFRYARSLLDSQEKFEYDLYYIKNRNLFLDIGIILKTAQIVFTHAGK